MRYFKWLSVVLFYVALAIVNRDRLNPLTHGVLSRPMRGAEFRDEHC
jgi:hypothetical protein